MNNKEKKCNGCEGAEKQEYQHSMEWEMMKELTKSNKRLYIIILTILVLWFTTTFGFIWYLNQYDYISDTEITASQDGDGNNFIGGGDITYGTNAESESTESAN